MKNNRYLTQEDATILSRCTENLLRVRDVRFNFAERLIDIISTSILLPEHDTRADFVSLYSDVTYRDVASGKMSHICIVCPEDANDASARVSILAPIPLALLGRQVGATVEVELPFNRVQKVEIVEVQPAMADPSAQPMWRGAPAP